MVQNGRHLFVLPANIATMTLHETDILVNDKFVINSGYSNPLSRLKASSTLRLGVSLNEGLQLPTIRKELTIYIVAY